MNDQLFWERWWRKYEARVDRSGGPDACQPWTGGKCGSLGYGGLGRREEHLLAHRVEWERHHGPLGEGEQVLHTCDNPPCCNIRHLFKGTQGDNQADMRAKGRHWKGDLTPDQVRYIRRCYRTKERTLASIGREFGRTTTLIWQVATGKSYLWVEEEAPNEI